MLLTSNCSEVAEIAGVTQRLRQFQQLLKTPVILILNFTRPHAITYTCISEVKGSNSSSNRETYLFTLVIMFTKTHKKPLLLFSNF